MSRRRGHTDRMGATLRAMESGRWTLCREIAAAVGFRRDAVNAALQALYVRRRVERDGERTNGYLWRKPVKAAGPAEEATQG